MCLLGCVYLCVLKRASVGLDESSKFRTYRGSEVGCLFARGASISVRSSARPSTNTLLNKALRCFLLLLFSREISWHSGKSWLNTLSPIWCFVDIIRSSEIRVFLDSSLWHMKTLIGWPRITLVVVIRVLTHQEPWRDLAGENAIRMLAWRGYAIQRIKTGLRVFSSTVHESTCGRSSNSEVAI